LDIPKTLRIVRELSEHKSKRDPQAKAIARRLAAIEAASPPEPATTHPANISQLGSDYAPDPPADPASEATAYFHPIRV
jgi:hypothetical protein